MGEGLGKKMKRIKKCKLPVINSHRDVKSSTGNVVNNVITGSDGY